MKYRRVNVSSRRQLEQLTHYSRALQVGDTVLQSGTITINPAGNVIGEGDVVRQVDTIIDIAETAMDKVWGGLRTAARAHSVAGAVIWPILICWSRWTRWRSKAHTRVSSGRPFDSCEPVFVLQP